MVQGSDGLSRQIEGLQDAPLAGTGESKIFFCNWLSVWLFFSYVSKVSRAFSECLLNARQSDEMDIQVEETHTQSECICCLQHIEQREGVIRSNWLLMDGPLRAVAS